MGDGMSKISINTINVLGPCDKRLRGYCLGDYFEQALSADNSYGNYHVKDNKYYLSKCVIARCGVIYLIDGNNTITINHRNLNIERINYSNGDISITTNPNGAIFGQKINITDPTFNMLHDPEYLEFYKKLMEIILDRDLKRDNKFYCGSCIKAYADVKLSCGHMTYCKDCIPLNNVICHVCLAKHTPKIQIVPKIQTVIDLSAFC